MDHKNAGDYYKKDSPDNEPNPLIALTIMKKAEDGKISCAAVFKIASDQGVSLSEAGKTLDLLGVKLTKCQLGLFGHSPQVRIVLPSERISPVLKSAIQDCLVEGRLPCANAWKIAKDLKIEKMELSCAAEAMKIRIKPCQLSVF